MAILSHELRTPLQAVLGYAEYLLNDPTAPLASEQREDVGYIHQGAMRMVTLIEQMLDLSRMEAGRLTLNIADVDLAEIIEQVRQDVAPQAEARGLALTVSVASDLPPVRADADRLRQILLNLAGNAVKFTDEGSVTISAVAEPNGVDVAVSDTGIGIALDAVSRIFEEFQQIDSPQTRRHGGAGLGLAIARGLAERTDGRISVTSEPGVGSTFTLHLPGRKTEDGRRKTAAR
jgi:signal transduction histidine kinase